MVLKSAMLRFILSTSVLYSTLLLSLPDNTSSTVFSSPRIYAIVCSLPDSVALLIISFMPDVTL